MSEVKENERIIQETCANIKKALELFIFSWLFAIQTISYFKEHKKIMTRFIPVWIWSSHTSKLEVSSYGLDVL